VTPDRAVTIRTGRDRQQKVSSIPRVEESRAASIDNRHAWIRPSAVLVGTHQQWRMAFGAKGQD